MTRCGLVSLANSLPQFPMLEAEKPVVVVVTARASPLDFADRDSAGKRVFVCVCVYLLGLSDLWTKSPACFGVQNAVQC